MLRRTEQHGQQLAPVASRLLHVREEDLVGLPLREQAQTPPLEPRDNGREQAYSEAACEDNERHNCKPVADRQFRPAALGVDKGGGAYEEEHKSEGQVDLLPLGWSRQVSDNGEGISHVRSPCNHNLVDIQ